MKKRAQVWDTLGPWIIGILLLVVVLIAYFIISGKWENMIEFFKNLLKFRR